MLRSLVALSPEDLETHHREEEFGLGDHLLICPVSQPKVAGRWAYLPDGDWIDYWTDQRHDGNNEVWVKTPLDQLPLFVRSGAVLPMGPSQLYVGEKPEAPLALHAYLPPGPEVVLSRVYEDAGDGDGPSVLKTFSLSRTACSQTRVGSFEERYPSYELVLHNADHISAVVVDGHEIPVRVDGITRVVENVDRYFQEITLK